MGTGPGDNGRVKRSELAALLEFLSDDESAAVRSWLGSDSPPGSSLRDHHETVVESPAMPSADDPRAIRTVGVIGGGTAGYLTALALRAKRPWLEVTLVESPSIPIIGVGEATVPAILPFLHHYLAIDPEDFYQRVRPTWKLGIKFDWGPNADGFMAPFDWSSNSIGMVGAVKANGVPDESSLLSLMMRANRTPVFEAGDRHLSLMKYLPFAYHLDNARFVGYLTELAARRGVRHVAATLADVVMGAEEWIDHLRTSDGRELRFDMYVDCTGFRSKLLGETLGTRFHSYGDSLFTDSAVTGNLDHGGVLKPYTSAITMTSGWCWNIPTPQDDHLGYVYASSAISDEAAGAELAERFPGISEPRVVRFRSGRHERAWRGNVMAVGNSYAFVEPLESTGILMITESIVSLVATLPASWSVPQPRETVNARLAERWDGLRWFLSLHYRFNTRLETAFWKDVQNNADISGAQPMLDIYATGAPMRFRNPVVTSLLRTSAPNFYGLAGVETILLGQGVPTRLLLATGTTQAWKARRAAADVLVRHALPQAEALAAFHSTPRLNRELLHDDDSWTSVKASAAIGMV